MTTAVTDSPVPLNVADRCDRCGAQAFFRATLAKNGDLTLLFCGHHGAKNNDQLILGGFTVEDFRESINEKPSLSSV